MWIFGYGSLIWRPDIPFVEKTLGYIQGFARRFYQGSPDHRGTPESPGRVVTLLPDKDAWCAGMAYKISPEAKQEILARLDYREQGGYERLQLDVFSHPKPSALPIVKGALVYLANKDNPYYLGPTSPEAMATHILQSVGPSGPNIDYLLCLASALRRLGVIDTHIFELERLALEKTRRQS